MNQRFARLFAGSVLAMAVNAAWAQDLAPSDSATTAPDDIVRFGISRFEVAGNTLLPAAEVERAVTPFTGAGRDFGDVQRALEALEALYHERGYKVVTVQLPEQELNGGVVHLTVLQTTIGRVTVAGNRHASVDNIRRSLPGLREGATPNLTQVSADLKLANENPAKKIKLSLESGQQDDTVDARVDVLDERPWTVMANFDNTGTKETGKTHAGLVLQHANLGGRDHVASLQYTTTVEEPSQVAVWGVGYHVPLYAQGASVDLYASYSDVDSGLVTAGLFDLAVSGRGAVYGARYNKVLAKRLLAGRELEGRIVYGLEVKAYKNSVVFFNQDFGSDVTVRPISIGYQGRMALENGEANFTATLLRNVSGGSRGDQAAFTAVRAGAKDGYTALRFAGAWSRALGTGDWQTRVLANGQYTPDALVPGEQFGAGGSTSVRGFDERELSTDSGLGLNLELYTPNLCSRGGWQCRLLAFYDTAHGRRNHALPGELRSTTIAGAGIGLRFAMGNSASVQVDYGKVVKEGALNGAGKDKLHVRVGLAY
ncbi:ShlB/FhaC/HecB family hemolysin secretion/activation protein [Telluria aromaticivorans]|uniref:ShlB/FhaC/HecB family hemolysin secretion/activation protein n=1 Tax=Telluria aromaticivorans TaxID=2725995 RepID=A0A7Y2NY38_9BURK|nr:ShlB/FhaC/HecB family hemolysin secretion/activation protein [Telluria aromaticivorans]NNG22377.1 ShlB/FhaC/HecB family hemolysin secretion/activation protein [Telluria aromaticivorans]